MNDSKAAAARHEPNDPLQADFLRQADRMQEIVIGVDPSERVRFVNRAYERATGFQREEVIGQQAHDLAAPRHGGPRYDRLRQALHRDGVWFGAYRLAGRDGATPWLSGQVSACRDATGRLTHYLALHRPALRERRENARLSQISRLENLGLLASSIAHDLNNTLTPILGYASMLASGHKPAKSEVYGKAIGSAATRAQDLVARVLTASRHRSEGFHGVMLQEVAQDVLRLIGPTLSRDIQVRTALHAPCPINGEPGLLYTLVLNLVVNAAQAMPGGGTLEILTGTAQMDGAPDQFGNPIVGPKAVLTVRDTGCGMTPDVLARVFDRFFTTKGPGGTGLGMYVVRRVLEQHHGQIVIQTRPGEGSRFRIYLPLRGVAHLAGEAALPVQLAVG